MPPSRLAAGFQSICAVITKQIKLVQLPEPENPISCAPQHPWFPPPFPCGEEPPRHLCAGPRPNFPMITIEMGASTPSKFESAAPASRHAGFQPPLPRPARAAPTRLSVRRDARTRQEHPVQLPKIPSHRVPIAPGGLASGAVLVPRLETPAGAVSPPLLPASHLFFSKTPRPCRWRGSRTPTARAPASRAQQSRRKLPTPLAPPGRRPPHSTSRHPKTHHHILRSGATIPPLFPPNRAAGPRKRPTCRAGETARRRLPVVPPACICAVRLLHVRHYLTRVAETPRRAPRAANLVPKGHARPPHRNATAPRRGPADARDEAHPRRKLAPRSATAAHVDRARLAPRPARAPCQRNGSPAPPPSDWAVDDRPPPPPPPRPRPGPGARRPPPTRHAGRPRGPQPPRTGRPAPAPTRAPRAAPHAPGRGPSPRGPPGASPIRRRARPLAAAPGLAGAHTTARPTARRTPPARRPGPGRPLGRAPSSRGSTAPPAEPHLSAPAPVDLRPRPDPWRPRHAAAPAPARLPPSRRTPRGAPHP